MTTDTTKQKTVLQILPKMQGGGVERGTIEIATAIKEAGMRPVVVAERGQLVQELEDMGAVYVELPVATKNPIKMWRNIKRIADVIKNYNVDIVHARSRAPAWSAYYAARKMKVPFVTTFHGTYGTSGGAIKKFYNGIMLRGKKIIAVSNFIYNHIRQTYKGIDMSRVVIIPRGADIKRFDPSKVSHEQVENLKKLWHVPAGKKVILMPSRVTPIKKIETLVEALLRAKDIKEFKDIYCVVVGSDHGREEYKKRLMEKIEAAGLSDRIKFFEAYKNIEVGYAFADIVLNAGIESFGRTSIEAQAMGAISVVPDQGGLMDGVEHGKTGFVFKYDDSNSLKNTLIYILGMSENELKVIKENAKKNASQNFSVENMCRKTIDLYKSV